MRSVRRAVVFSFTLILSQINTGWTGGIAHAEASDLAHPGASDFLQDCATLTPDAQRTMVIGRPAEQGNALVVAVGQTGIYETRDRGETWALLTPAGQCHRPVRAFWDNNPDGDTLCVVTPPNGGGFNTYCSYDRGRSWQPQTWIKDAVHVLFDPSDASRAFGWTPTNRCNKICSGPTYAIAMAHAKSSYRHCACNLQLGHSASDDPHLLAVRDIDNSGQNQLVSMSQDMEQETVLIRETNPNMRILQVYTNPTNSSSFVVTVAKRSPLGSETGLCCDALYESIDRGRSRGVVPLFFGPLDDVQFTSPFGDIAALVRPPHAPFVAYIGRKPFGLAEWAWARAPEPQGKLLAAGDSLYFAGRHLYRVDTSPYTVIDPVN